jgi:HlyD family secretion protein
MAQDLNQFETLENFLTQPPSWMLRSGISLIGIFFLLFLGISWLVSFPDRIISKSTIRTISPPLDVVNNFGGRIDSILVKSYEKVKTDQIIGVMHNPGNHLEILRLEKWLNFEATKPPTFKAPHTLGEIQPMYLAWVQALTEYSHYKEQNLVFEQINALSQEKVNTLLLRNELQDREKLFIKENELVKTDLDRHQILHTQKVISDQEVDAKKITWFQAERSFSATTEDALRNDIRVSQIDAEKIKLLTERENLLIEKKASLQKAIIDLKLAISLWKNKYIVFSPMDGELIWQTDISEGKYLSPSKQIATIIPENVKQRIVAVCLTPVTGSGRIEKGNIVKIELDAFPFEEFGKLEGVVESISPLPISDRNEHFFYQVMVELPNTLISNYAIEIPFQQNLTGRALILTKKRTLFNKIFEGLTKQLNRM